MTRLLVAGVDACPRGWVAVTRDGEAGRLQAVMAPDFAQLMELLRGAAVVAVDIPIGLPDRPERGGRPADLMARQLLGPGWGSSVFPAPCRAVLRATSHSEANRLSRETSPGGKGLSIQAFHLIHRIGQVDEYLGTPEVQSRVREVHPELCFWALNGGRALSRKKATPEGREERRNLLSRAGFDVADLLEPPSGGRKVAPVADVLDAAAACWTAGRIANGKACRIPENSGEDSRGLRMEMWY